MKELNLDPKRFAITIFKGDADAPRDDEAEQIWLVNPESQKEQIFVSDKRQFLGTRWKTGPCGPCSEIHYDRGEHYGKTRDQIQMKTNDLWKFELVFMEYDKKEDGEA